MRLEFEWDEKKREKNLEKHGVDFRDAEMVFRSGFIATEDTRKQYNEMRYIGLGELNDILVFVAFTERSDTIRIISMREATDEEKEVYYG